MVGLSVMKFRPGRQINNSFILASMSMIAISLLDSPMAPQLTVGDPANELDKVNEVVANQAMDREDAGRCCRSHPCRNCAFNSNRTRFRAGQDFDANSAAKAEPTRAGFLRPR
jgi:hypothetical protein